MINKNYESNFHHLIKFEKKISDFFWSTLLKNNLEITLSRKLENSQNIDNRYSFLYDYKEFLHNLNLVKVELTSLINIIKTNPRIFTKSKEILDAWKNIIELDYTISKIYKIKTNSLEDSTIFFDFFSLHLTLTLDKAQIVNWELNENEDDEDEHLQLGSKYSKTAVLSNFYKQMENFLLIVSTSLEIDLDLKNFEVVIASFLLFLEKERILVLDKKKTAFSKSQFRSLVSYNFEIKNKYKSLTFFANFYLKVSKNQPILLINKHLSSKNMKKAVLLQIPDYIFNVNQVFRTNNNYGFIEYEYGIETTNESNIFNQIQNEKMRKKVRKSSYQVFTEELKDVNPLYQSIKKQNQTKFFIDKIKLKNLIELFIQTNLVDMGLNIKSEYSEILIFLEKYSEILSPENKEIFKNLFIFLQLKILFEKYENNEYYYKLFFFDFRGRNYKETMISITNFKLSRFFLFFGYYEKEELRTIVTRTVLSKSFNIIKNSNFDLKKIKEVCHEDYFSNCELSEELANFFDFKKIILIQHVYSIGIIFKSSILKDKKKSKDGFSISLKSLFDKGLEEIFKYKADPATYVLSFKDEEDKLKFNFFLEKIITKPNFLKKESMGLDFSCSGHQIRYLFHKFKNLSNFRYINIDGNEVGCDFYSFLIKNFKIFFYKFVSDNFDLKPSLIADLTEKDTVFLKKHRDALIELYEENGEELTKKLLGLLHRSVCKKPLMVSEYNASIPTFLNYFKKKLDEQERALYNDNEFYMTAILTIFYNYAKNLNKFKEFECENNSNIVYSETISLNFKKTFFDGFILNLSNFDIDYKSRRVVILNKEKKRITHVLATPLHTVNFKKTKTSFMPNFCHALDGAIVRLTTLYYNNYIGKTEEKFDMATVHDEYWIPYQETCLFRDFMNEAIKKDFFSPTTYPLNFKNHKLYTNKIKNLYCIFVIF